jgi:hypothetical protein
MPSRYIDDLERSIFEPPPPPEPPGREDRRPIWAGPPNNVLPGIVPVQLVIARTQDTAVAVIGIRAYPNGLAFTLSVRLRHERDEPVVGLQLV